MCDHSTIVYCLPPFPRNQTEKQTLYKPSTSASDANPINLFPQSFFSPNSLRSEFLLSFSDGFQPLVSGANPVQVVAAPGKAYYKVHT